MKKHMNLGRRVIAGLGAAAVGLVGFAGAASADTVTGTGNINPDTATSLTIHKYDGTAGTEGNGTELSDTSGLGNALAGVEFTITPVTAKDGATIDLDTAAGWDLIDGVTAADVQGSGYTVDTANATVVTTGTDGSVEAADLPHGLYLVTETGYGDNSITTPVDPFLVTLPLPQGDGGWLYDVHVYPKNAVDTNVPTKDVADPTNGVTIGSTVPWTISAPVQPDAPGDITSFVITDQLDTRLTYASLSIDGYTEGTDYTFTVDGQLVTIEFTAEGAAKLTAGDVVTITLNTTVNSLGDGVIPNQATVYTNGNDGKTTSKPGEPGTNPTSNWGPLEVLKYADGDTSKTLAGAEFAVYSDEAATDQVGTFTTDADGKGSIVLWVGNDDDTTETYYLKETKAPAGYVLDDQVRTVEVKAGEAATVVVTEIPNTQQDHPDLPLTGASGQLLMTVGGLALVLLAGGGAMVVRSRKRASLQD